MTRAETAQDLEISTATVRVHLERAKRRMEARNTTAAVVEALKRGEFTISEV
jgi:DNA-binding CsgD family transcriptional regulator